MTESSQERRSKWFGPEGSWDSPFTDEAEHIDTPVLEECVACDVMVVPGDTGVLIPRLSMDNAEDYSVFHKICWLRQLFGPEESWIPELKEAILGRDMGPGDTKGE